MTRQCPGRKRGIRGTPLGGALLLAFSCLLLATGAGFRSEKLKAAYVFNFLKFTQWPESLRPKPKLTLCLANATPALEQAFAELEGRTINAQTLTVRSLGSHYQAAGCQVLFLHQGGAPLSLHQLSRRNPELLTIGDDENFIQQGGLIALIEDQGHLQFDINLAQLRHAHFRISAQLLKLARNTRSQGQ